MKITTACRLTVCIAIFCASGALAQTAVTFKAGANGQVTFVMPSKTTECTFTPAGGTPVYKPFDGGPELSCDRSEPKYVRVVLTPKSIKRFNNVGDQSCCGVDNVFAHGSRWTQGPFICESAEAGLTCKRADGKGFFMGAKDIKLQ
jgi:hypothetical protein